MTEPLRRITSDQIIDSREAAEAVRTYKAGSDARPLANAMATDLKLSAADALTLAKAVQVLAKEAIPGSFINFRPGKGLATAPDLQHEAFTVIGSADVTRSPMAGIPVAILRNWGELRPALQGIKSGLDQKRRSDPLAHLTIAFNVHGNNGSGFKLMNMTDTKLPTGGVKRHADASVASAAYIQQEMTAAGLKPEDVTVVSEACNGAHAYLTTVDGFSPDEAARVKRNVAKLALEDQEDWTKGKPTNRFEIGQPVLFDATSAASRQSAKREFTWLGWSTGCNTTYSFVAYGAGQRTTVLQPDSPGKVSPGSAKMVIYSRMVAAGWTEGVIKQSGEQHNALNSQFVANGGGKPFVLGAIKPPPTPGH